MASTLEKVTVSARVLIGIRAQVEKSEIGGFFARTLSKVHQMLTANNLKLLSAPLGYYFSGPPKFDLVSGYFVESVPQAIRDQLKNEDASIFIMDVPDLACLKKTYVGPYDGLKAAWDEVWQVMPGPDDSYWATHKACWEEYVTDPLRVDVPTTDIYVQHA